VGNLSAIFAVMHQEHLKLLGVVHDKLIKSVGKQVAGLLVRSVTDLGLRDGALKSSAHARIDTLGLSPRRAADAGELLVLVTLEALRALLDDLVLDEWGNLGHFIVIYAVV